MKNIYFMVFIIAGLLATICGCSYMTRLLTPSCLQLAGAVAGWVSGILVGAAIAWRAGEALAKLLPDSLGRFFSFLIPQRRLPPVVLVCLCLLSAGVFQMPVVGAQVGALWQDGHSAQTSAIAGVMPFADAKQFYSAGISMPITGKMYPLPARRARLIIEGAKIEHGQAVLEIGCGTGNFTEKFAVSGASILACDVSPDLIEMAKTRNLDPGQVRFVCHPFESLPCTSLFDAVIGSSVLHHLNLNMALGKIYELLKPGGRLCFAEPNMLNPQVFAAKKFKRFFPEESPDETAFLRFQLGRHLRSTGFSDIYITPFDWLHPATPEKFIPIVQQVGAALEKTPLLKEFSGSLLISAKKVS